MIVKNLVPEPDAKWSIYIHPALQRTRHPLIVDITCAASEERIVHYGMLRHYKQARKFGLTPYLARRLVIGDLFLSWETKVSQPHRREAA